jgi:hypothetical protein
MHGRLIFLLTAALAAAVPWLALPRQPSRLPAFPGWPATFDGRTLHPMPIGEGEKRFESEFPGRIGRFTDGSREIVIRWVTEATRKLHPSADCWGYAGFEIKPLPLRIDAAGLRWATFEAHRGDEHLRVFERIADDHGHGWTDVSEWYWSALTGDTSGPWWTFAWAQRIQ